MDAETLAKSSVPAADARAAESSLRASLVKGVMWTGGVKWLAQLLSWPIMIVIARILSPADYGFVALVTVWTRLIMLLTEGGVGSAIVFGPVLAIEQLKQLNLLAVVLSAVAFLMACALAFPIAHFYRNGDLAWVMVGVAATFMLEGIMLIPAARMRRQMRFRELAFADAGRAVADSVVTLSIAMLGGRYWALVGGYAAGVLAVSGAVLFFCPTGFSLPRWSDLRATIRYAFHLLLASLTAFIYSSADMIVAGRILSASSVGAYSFAGTLAYAPGEKLVAVLTRVTPSVFGTLGGDKAGMWTYVRHITKLLAVGMLPILGGIGATAGTLVYVLLGPRWAGAVLPLQILCIYAAVVAVTGIVPQALQSSGNARVVAENGVMAVLLYPPAFILMGTAWGTTGLAVAWASITPFLVCRLVVRLCGALEVSVWRYVGLLLPALASTAWMVLCVLSAAHLAIQYEVPRFALLTFEVAVGIAAYLLALVILDKSSLFEMWHRIREVASQKLRRDE